MRSPITFHQAGGANHIYLGAYKEWLNKQVMTANTSRVYYSRIKQFLLFLEYAKLGDKPINDSASMNKAVSAYLEFLKQAQKGNSTVNANINALKNFSQFLGLGDIQLKRERCYDKTTKVLTLDEQERFLDAVEQQESTRDKALALILFYTGLRIGDCARLNINNIGAGAACISIESGAKILLNDQIMLALKQWLERRKKLANVDEHALWITKQGQRLTMAGIAFVIGRIGWQAKLTVSVETLRRTWLLQATDHLTKDQLASKFGGYISKATIAKYGLSLHAG